jgi:formate C-acetyltransferase
MTKVDQSVLPTGTLQNMKFNLSTLKNHEDKFIALLRTYMELGGYHVQFNIIDTAVLKEAQRFPEKYAGLVVRVAAYAAEFTALPKALQDDIIKRSELGFD